MEFTEEIYKELNETTARSKSNTKRLDTLENKVEDLRGQTVEVAVLKQDMDHVKLSVDEIKTDVKTLTEKPSKRWEAVVAAVIGGLVGYFLRKLGVF